MKNLSYTTMVSQLAGKTRAGAPAREQSGQHAPQVSRFDFDCYIGPMTTLYSALLAAFFERIWFAAKGMPILAKVKLITISRYAT